MDAVFQFFQYFQRGFDYLFQRWDRVSPFLWEHLRICGISLAVAFAIAFPVGLLLSRFRWLSTPVLGFLGILYTIPSLAFLAFLVPVFGLSPVTTIVVLIVYSQTMMVRNITLGFNSVDSAVVEAGQGMGMNKWQLLWWVEFPIALPLVLAGLRIATLAIISIATIGAWAGADTLGKLFQEDNPRKSAAGIILVVLIALLADQFFRMLERLAVKYRSKKGPARRNTPEKILDPVAG